MNGLMDRWLDEKEGRNKGVGGKEERGDGGGREIGGDGKEEAQSEGSGDVQMMFRRI